MAWLLNIIFPIALAHPVPFKDGTAVTSLNQSFNSDTTIAYSFHKRAAVAARLVNFDDRIGSMQYYAPQINVLIRRWNFEEAQANLYSLSGVGTMNYDGHTHSSILTGLEADAESRRLYVSSRAEKMWTGMGYDFWHLQGRAGVAPYKAGYNQVATWFIAQYDYNPILRSKYKLTPLVRLFYRTVLVEGGVSTDGDWLMNLMLHI